MVCQPFGWFRKEVKTARDFQGLKYRTVGLSIDVFKNMGAAVVAMPGGFLLLSQFIIFLPMPGNLDIDPLFFGLLTALNLQTDFRSPPMAMAADYLKGVAPPHVTLAQIFPGMIPFMVLLEAAMVLLHLFPAIGLWLPGVLYK